MFSEGGGDEVREDYRVGKEEGGGEERKPEGGANGKGMSTKKGAVGCIIT